MTPAFVGPENGIFQNQLANVVMQACVCQQGLKDTQLRGVWVPRMSMGCTICVEMDRDDVQTPLTTVYCVCQPSNGLRDLFWGARYRKVRLLTDSS